MASKRPIEAEKNVIERPIEAENNIIKTGTYLVPVFTVTKLERQIAEQNTIIKHSQPLTKVEVRPFQCDQCSKVFERKSDLKRHKRTHSKEKRYHCEPCGALFDRVEHQQKHMETCKLFRA